MSNYNEILIVGNGYDLANGLKSSFSDYMKIFLREYIFVYIYNLYTKEHSSDNDFKFILSFFMSACQMSEQKETSFYVPPNYFDNQFIKILLHKYCPVITLLQAYIEPWMVYKDFVYDFANSKNTINGGTRALQHLIFKLFKELKKNNVDITLNLQWFDVESIIAEVINGNISSDLEKFVIPEKKEEFYSFLRELNLSDNQQFFKETINNINLQECHEGLELFSESFSIYLKKEEEKYNNKSYKINRPTDILDTIFDYVISLNYTSVSKKALKQAPNENNYCHIHGSLKQNNIVIGTGSYSYDELVSDPTKINDINKIPFYKFFLRILKDTDENYHDWIDDKCYALTFYGFSFGINDYDLIRELLLKLDNNNKNTIYINPDLMSITIYCLNLEDKYKILRNLIACLNKNIINRLKHILHFEIISI